MSFVSPSGTSTKADFGLNVTFILATAAELDSTLRASEQTEEHQTNLWNLSSKDWYKQSCDDFQKTISLSQMVLLPIICGCGIVGIVLTMVVLSRKTMCTSTNCYLCALAVADLLFLLVFSSKIVVDITADCRFYQDGIDAVYFVYSAIFMDTFQSLSVGVTVMLALERYIAICHPMNAMTLCTVKRARIIILLLSVVSFILQCPRFLDIQVTSVMLTTGEEKTVVTWHYQYDSRAYAYIVTGLLLTILPLITLMVLNFRLIVEIRRSSKYLKYYLGTDHQVRSIVSREELKITMMLVSVIIAFFIGHAPNMVCNFITAIINYDVENQLIDQESLKNVQTVSRILLVLKSSCNFILYCWFSEKFWTTFKRTFCLHQCIPRLLSHQTNGYTQQTFHRPSYYMTKVTTC